MISYSDAVGDRGLYVSWLIGERSPHDHDELAGIVAKIIRDGGYTMTGGFASGLRGIHQLDLAEFMAANSAFETDDKQWAAHCETYYPRDEHGSETVGERNGAMVSWGGAEHG